MFRSTIVNSYPRVGDQPGQQKLRSAFGRFDKRAITLDEIKKVEDEVTIDAIREQEQAGLDLVSDGQIRWEDAQTYIARSLPGFEITGLIRYFDTNTYYRQPVAVGEISWESPILVRDFEFAKSHAKRPVKAILTGPYTLAKLSLDRHYKSPREFTLAIARALNSEVKALEKAGATFIQIDEPAITRNKKDFPLFADALAAVTAGVSKSTQTCLCTYFGDLTGIFPDLVKLPVDVLGLDCQRLDGNWAEMRMHAIDKKLQLGLLDARNTSLEDADTIVERLAELRTWIRGREVWIAPNAGLEFLPRQTAFEKLQRAAEIAKKAQERIG